MRKILCAITAAVMLALAINVNVFAKENAIQVEFEDYLDQNSGFSQTQTVDGGAMAGVSKISSGVYTYTVSFNAENEGEYTMQLAAAAYAEGLTVNYSDVSWSLNGSDAVSLNDAESKTLLDTSGTPQRTLFVPTAKVWLEKGENTLVLSGGKRSGKPMVTFYLDYAKFVSEEEEPEKRRWEIEEITADGIVSDANTSGGKFQVYKSTDTEDVIQHFEGTIAKSGEYTLSFACGDYSNMPYLSQLYFSVNGGEYIEINDTECSVSQLESLANSGLQGTFGLYKYSYKGAVNLDAGAFTVDIKAIKRIKNEPGDGVYFSFDYMEIEDRKEPEPVIGSGRLEVEDITSTCIANDKNVSGGKYQVYKSTETEDVIQRFTFKTDERGMYTVSVAAGTFAKMAYLSSLYISINGGEYIELNDANCYITQLDELADPAMRATYNLYSYTYKQDISIEEDITTVDVRATARTNAEATPGVYFSLDYVEVLQVKQLDGLSGKTDHGFVACGKDEQLRIFNADGKEITAAGVTSIKYTSDDEKIVSVDSDGVLHGRNFGKAVIHIEADRTGVTASADCTVYVTDESGLYLTDGKRNGNEISVTINAVQDYKAQHQLLIAVYGNEDGYATSIKKIYTVDTEDLSKGESKQIQKTVEAESGDVINIFMIYPDNNTNAVFSKITL